MHGFGVALVLAAAAGCGGSSDSNQFVGTWKITQASNAVACDDGTAGSFTVAGNVEFAVGVSTALVTISPSELDGLSVCDFGFDVSGPTATIHGTQSCTLTRFSTAAVDATFSPTSWTFSLTGPNAAEETGAATVHLPTFDATGAPTGGTTVCQYTGHMATLARVARN